MAGPFAYRSGFGPTPAPVEDVTIGWRGRVEPLQALIDSGASGTLIPDSLVAKLALRKIGEVKASGYDASKVEPRDLYAADIVFLGFRFDRHPVVAVPRTYVLIGRDLLNRYKTTLDGPRLEFVVE